MSAPVPCRIPTPVPPPILTFISPHPVPCPNASYSHPLSLLHPVLARTPFLLLDYFCSISFYPLFHPPVQLLIPAHSVQQTTHISRTSPSHIPSPVISFSRVISSLIPDIPSHHPSPIPSPIPATIPFCQVSVTIPSHPTSPNLPSSHLTSHPIPSTFPQQQPQLPAPHPTWKRGLEVTWGWGFAGPGLPFKDQGLQQGPWARAEVSPGPNSRGRAH